MVNGDTDSPVVDVGRVDSWPDPVEIDWHQRTWSPGLKFNYCHYR